MATESVAGNETSPSLPELVTNEENLNENGETCESYSEVLIQDDDLSVPNTESNYQPEPILNILTAAIANTQSVSNLSRVQESEEFSRRRHQGNRWQELKRLIQKHTSKIRNSRWCVYGLILLMVLPTSAMSISLKHRMECRRSTTVIVFLSGVIGFLLLICRLVTVTIRNFCTTLRGKEPTAVSKALFIGLLFLFLVGMLAFYLVPPVFDPSSEDYCVKDFYTYINGMNIIVSYIFFIALLLHVPEYL
ncbi:uncharacterized protein TNCT_602982 [Trichonephila clavata]|uniref:Uncharacterized protein n=1 Tax=Trichonephila clavata TaxID=2740835 RepID=A0A8X6ID93_TRICU|nr:uncharacterized protein TNCT_602982 [Trichonephila clavata]